MSKAGRKALAEIALIAAGMGVELPPLAESQPAPPPPMTYKHAASGDTQPLQVICAQMDRPVIVHPFYRKFDSWRAFYAEWLPDIPAPAKARRKKTVDTEKEVTPTP
ncbi:MAG: hypothetical protein ACYDCO_01890 [Armatimonadota bacterium]